jgi:hypothetical protein
MTIRAVTPASGGAGISFAWDCGTVWQPAGALLDVPPGGALETAIGLSNLTTLSAGQLASAVNGEEPASASNA